MNAHRRCNVLMVILSGFLLVAPQNGFTQPDNNADSSVVAAEKIIAIVEAWAKAWSDRDVDSYLAYYSSDFRLPDKQSRQVWEQQRRRLVTTPESIRITVKGIKVDLLDKTMAWAHFEQDYTAGARHERSNILLGFMKEGGDWKIVHELHGEDIEARYADSKGAAKTTAPKPPVSPETNPEEALKLDIEAVDRGNAGIPPTPVNTGTFSSRNENDAAVQRVVKKHERPMQYVYRRELKYNPNLRGTVKVRLAIQADGRVSKADILSDTVQSKTLAQFIERFARSWQIDLKDPRAFTTDLTLMFVPPQNSRLNLPPAPR